MTVRERVVVLLGKHPQGLDDDEVSERVGWSRRQRASTVCRALARDGLVTRCAVHGKIRNVLTAPVTALPPAAILASPSPPVQKPWCWEGNVVGAVVKHLVADGWTIQSVADTATGQAGADIEARRGTELLIVEVKGYPSKTYERGAKQGQPKPTNPPTQARHWIAEALLTALLRQADGRATRVALAFPEFRVYRTILKRIAHACAKLELEILIVRESGEVVVFDK
jgi:hypothetical protein